MGRGPGGEHGREVTRELDSRRPWEERRGQFGLHLEMSLVI